MQGILIRDSLSHWFIQEDLVPVKVMETSEGLQTRLYWKYARGLHQKLNHSYTGLYQLWVTQFTDTSSFIFTSTTLGVCCCSCCLVLASNSDSFSKFVCGKFKRFSPGTHFRFLQYQIFRRKNIGAPPNRGRSHS